MSQLSVSITKYPDHGLKKKEMSTLAQPWRVWGLVSCPLTSRQCQEGTQSTEAVRSRGRD